MTGLLWQARCLHSPCRPPRKSQPLHLRDAPAKLNPDSALALGTLALLKGRTLENVEA